MHSEREMVDAHYRAWHVERCGWPCHRGRRDGMSEATGRGSSMALRGAGNSSPIGARVHRVLKGWTVDGGHLPPGCRFSLALCGAGNSSRTRALLCESH